MAVTANTKFWNQPAAISNLNQLGQDPSGLTSAEAEQRFRQFGPNRLSEIVHRNLIAQIGRRLIEPLVAILLAAAIVSGATGDKVSFVIIFLMVFLSIGLDVFQERNATRAAEALRRTVAIKVHVKRDGKLESLDAEHVVPGDIAIISPGDLIPADGLVVSSDAARTNEALMTGEPYPVDKRRGPSGAHDAASAYDALFGGTALVSGIITMLVTATGRSTMLGSIASALQSKEPPTAFERGLHQLGILILRLTVFLVSFVLLAQLAFHRPALESFMFAIALAVGLTPELLPMVTTVTLSRGAVRMAQRKVIVKKLSAIHDLGSMDVLCTDKTGTLTEAKIELQDSCNAQGKEEQTVLLLAALDAKEGGFGNPLDSAISRAAAKLDLSEWNLTGDIPFDFERRRASVVVEHDGRRLLITKGAPESILALSTFIGQPGESPLALRSEARTKILALHDSKAALGLRMLGVAWRELSKGHTANKTDECGMVFAGLCVFADPPKLSAGTAIARLQKLNVRVKIISGDAAAVVLHLVKTLNIDAKGILSGDEIGEMSDHELAVAMDTHDIFARIAPDQKVRIIRTLSSSGHVVGFLGDGINDAPAIRAADAGLSVQGATDVAQAAADLILLDSDLGVVADGVEEGRRTYANIMKYLRMGTSSNFGNMLSMALASLAIPFLPLTAIQILLNNFLYDLSQTGIPFDNVDSIETAAPHRWNMKAILRMTLTMGPLSSVFDLLTFAILIFGYHALPAEFRTAWFVESITTQILVVFLIRTRELPWKSRPHPVLLATALLSLSLALFVALGPVSTLFGFVTLPLPLLGLLGCMALAYLLSAEAMKRFAMRD